MMIATLICSMSMLLLGFTRNFVSIFTSVGSSLVSCSYILHGSADGDPFFRITYLPVYLPLSHYFALISPSTLSKLLIVRS